jgi:diaminopimelate epimerase
MIINFHKYQGTGNDFIVIDNRDLLINPNLLDIASICDRRFGIGADGLILIQNHDDLDFHMIYFNSDGSQSFCGNGSRCALAFAKKLGIIKTKARFLSTDGIHESNIDGDQYNILMHDVSDCEKGDHFYFINTGSPHYILFVDDVVKIELLKIAREIRYSERFERDGVNVNFVEAYKDILKVRTYERGVEDETLSCGTGVTAVALAWHLKNDMPEGHHKQEIVTPGGRLLVSYNYLGGQKFSDIHLIGPAEAVFEGQINVEVFDSVHQLA